MSISTLELLFKLNVYHAKEVDKIIFKMPLCIREDKLKILGQEAINNDIEKALEQEKTQTEIDNEFWYLYNFQWDTVDFSQMIDLILVQRLVDPTMDAVKLIRDRHRDISTLQENFDDAPTLFDGFCNLADQINCIFKYESNIYLTLQKKFLDANITRYRDNITREEESYYAIAKPYYDLYYKINFFEVAGLLMLGRKTRYTLQRVEDTLSIYRYKYKGKKVFVKHFKDKKR